MGQTNAPLLQVFVWRTQNGSIHLSSDDRRLVDETGKYRGINVAVSKQRQPQTYKRLAALLDREQAKDREVPTSAQERRKHKTRQPKAQSGASDASENEVS